MRRLLPFALILASGCSGTLYTHYAGPVASQPNDVYACVQEQMKTLGYTRKQFNESERWFVGEKITKEGVSSGLYKQTIHTIDTRVKPSANGPATLDIIARTFDEFATARGDDRQERKASERVQIDARTLGQACAK